MSLQPDERRLLVWAVVFVVVCVVIGGVWPWLIR
jgi:hypothetical protein